MFMVHMYKGAGLQRHPRGGKVIGISWHGEKKNLKCHHKCLPVQFSTPAVQTISTLLLAIYCFNKLNNIHLKGSPYRGGVGGGIPVSPFPHMCAWRSLIGRSSVSCLLCHGCHHRHWSWHPSGASQGCSSYPDAALFNTLDVCHPVWGPRYDRPPGKRRGSANTVIFTALKC